MGHGFIHDELAAFLETGTSMVVATRSAALVPHATRACGIRALEDERISVLLPRPTSALSIEHLRENGCIAVCISSPRDFRTVQLKGRSLAIDDASAEDLITAEEQLRRFGDAVLQYGTTRKQARNLWLFDSWRVTVLVTSAYAQTPGPGAGAAMDHKHGS